MKRLDFSFRNDSEATLVDAVQKTTFTAPIDITGKTRLTRFKLSEGAFPLCSIGPSRTVFTTREKELLDTYGKTPTDLYFGWQLSENTDDGNTGKSRGSSFMLKTNAVPVALPFRVLSPMTNVRCFIQLFFISAPPIWKRREDGWILANEDTFLYNIDELYTSPRFDMQSNMPVNVLNVTQVNDNIKFSLNLQTRPTAGKTAISTPYLMLSETFLRILNKEPSDGYKVSYQYLPAIFGLGQNCIFYPLSCEYNYNIWLDSLLRSNGTLTQSGDMDFSTTSTIHLSEDKSFLFPYTAIIVMIDEFNNPGEHIVVNNPSSTGVVNLSTLSITKLFIIGQSNYERSDFVYVNDSLQESPLDINLPRQLNLTIRLFFLLKTNELIPLKIPPHQNFFVQLSVQSA